MATQVAGEQYYHIDGQLAEIKRQLRQPAGYPFDPNQLQQALQLVIEGKFQPAPKIETAGTLAGGVGWKVFKDGQINPFDVDFLGASMEVFRDDEHLPDDWDPYATKLLDTVGQRLYPTSFDTCSATRGQKKLGAKAFWWYWNNPTKIPKDWRKKYVCFDATIFCDNNTGEFYVLYLDHESGSCGWDTYRTDESRVKGTFSACLP